MSSNSNTADSTDAKLKLFCSHCDAILPLPSSAHGARCTTCGALEPFVQGVVRRTKMKVADNVSDGVLRRYADLAGAEMEEDARATIAERCPKCNHDTLRYTTAQLRSADEGTTVFYECEKCGHKFTVTN